jgi:predicted RNA-binding protein
MGQLAERLDGIEVHARVPGIEIEAVLRNRSDVTISFGEAVYEFISEVRLENYLASLARLVYAGWLRQYREAIDDSTLDVTPVDQRDHDFIEARSEIESSGASSDGRISFAAVGMQEITATIQPGTLRELTEEQFTDRAKEAVAALIRDYLGKVRELKLQFYT